MAYGKGGGGRKKFDDTNRGVLFGNDKKTSAKHPDLKGKINIAGKEYWLSGWFDEYEKDGQKKRKLSLAVTEKENAPTADMAPKPAPAAQPADDKGKPFNDDLPW